MHHLTQRILVGSFCTLLAIMALALSAQAGGAQKVDVLRFPGGSCSTGAIPGSGAVVGFANINTNGTNTVSAEISLKNGLPNTTYNVELVQTPSGENCFGPPEAKLTTNAQGNGNVHVDEPLLAASTDAFVLLQSTTGPFDFLVSPDVTF